MDYTISRPEGAPVLLRFLPSFFLPPLALSGVLAPSLYSAWYHVLSVCRGETPDCGPATRSLADNPGPWWRCGRFCIPYPPISSLLRLFCLAYPPAIVHTDEYVPPPYHDMRDLCTLSPSPLGQAFPELSGWARLTLGASGSLAALPTLPSFRYGRQRSWEGT